MRQKQLFINVVSVNHKCLIVRAVYLFFSARQAVKNTPKRVPSVTVRSSSGACSPSLDFPIGDPSEDPSTTVCFFVLNLLILIL